MKQPSNDPESRIAQLRLVDGEVSARVNDYQSRIQALDARAGVLVAAATVVVTLAVGSASNGWVIAAAAAALVSAVLGAVALLPTKGRAVRPQALRDAVYGRKEGAALLWLIDHKIETLATNERRVSVKARLLQIGFGLFAASAVLLVLSVTTLQVRFT